MKKSKLFFAFLVVQSIAAKGESEIDRRIAGCAKIEGSTNRLFCYDDISKKVEPIVSPPELTKGSDWIVDSNKSKINDKTNYSLNLESENEFAGRFQSSTRATLMIVCREGRTDFFISMGDLFLADNSSYGSVTFRTDKDKARQISMKESTDNSALGLWGGSSIKFLKSLFGKSKLFARVTPFNESSVDAEFNITGLEKAIAPLRSGCKW